MKVSVRAKPGAKAARVTRVERDGGLFAAAAKGGAASSVAASAAPPHFIVAVKEPAKEGRANRAIERALAEHFGVPPSRVRIVAGHTSREKIAEIAE